jgi:hypothetical protein
MVEHYQSCMAVKPIDLPDANAIAFSLEQNRDVDRQSAAPARQAKRCTRVAENSSPVGRNNTRITKMKKTSHIGFLIINPIPLSHTKAFKDSYIKNYNILYINDNIVKRNINNSI